MKPFSIEGFAKRYVASQDRYMQSYEDLEAARILRLNGEVGRLSIIGKTIRHSADSLRVSLDRHDFQTNAMFAGLNGAASAPLEVAEELILRTQIQTGDPDG